MDDIISLLENIKFLSTALLISSCALVGFFCSFMVVVFIKFRDLL